MKTLIIYDSLFGNTEKIAQAIGAAVGGEVEVLRADAVQASHLQGIDLLFAGSPTYGGQPTDAMKAFLERIPAAAVQGTRVATFDTRMTNRLLRIIGFAAGKIAGGLQKMGAAPVGSAEGFFVLGGEGPLKEGELERAAAWAKGIAAAAG
jgi:flavodoxin I